MTPQWRVSTGKFEHLVVAKDPNRAFKAALMRHPIPKYIGWAVEIRMVNPGKKSGFGTAMIAYVGHTLTELGITFAQGPRKNWITITGGSVKEIRP
jgi:hypothetical protein